MGVVQNRPIFTPGVANSASARRHGQIAGRHQLASGGRGQPLHAGDDRLRELPDLLHDVRTAREEGLIVGLGPARHFRQIVTRAEDGARRGQHHDPRGAIRGDPLKRRPEFGQHGLGERIAPLGPIQRQPDHPGLRFHKQHAAIVAGIQGNGKWRRNVRWSTAL